MNAAIAQRIRRVALPWRIVLVIYFCAMTASTHWPGLDLTDDNRIPSPDKLIHALAFGGLAFLLWRTRWVRSLPLLLIITLLWCAIDEATQGVPGLHREISAADVVASMTGVIVTVTGLWAFSFVGGIASRRRQKLINFALDEVFSTWWIWPLLIVAFAAGVAAASILVWQASLRVEFVAETLMRVAVLAASAGGLTLAVLLIFARWRVELAQVMRQRPCLTCGGPTDPAGWDKAGRASCAACGETLHRGDWIEPIAPPMARMLRTIWLPALIAAAIAVAAPIALLYAATRPGLVVTFAQMRSTLRNLDSSTESVVDLALYILLILVAIRFARARLAKIIDEQDNRCRSCGHDLRATPVDRGVGVCGECGTEFQAGFTTEDTEGTEKGRNQKAEVRGQKSECQV